VRCGGVMWAAVASNNGWLHDDDVRSMSSFSCFASLVSDVGVVGCLVISSLVPVPSALINSCDKFVIVVGALGGAPHQHPRCGVVPSSTDPRRRDG